MTVPTWAPKKQQQQPQMIEAIAAPRRSGRVVEWDDIGGIEDTMRKSGPDVAIEERFAHSGSCTDVHRGCPEMHPGEDGPR